MMRIYLSLFFLLLLGISAYPQSNGQKLSAAQNFDFIWNAKQMPSSEMNNILKNLSDSLAIEFSNIYPVTTIIPQKDNCSLAEKLKRLGFVVVNSGRGNWMKGPRMINYFLESDRFICRVDKLYYLDTTSPGHYIITERFACLAKR